MLVLLVPKSLREVKCCLMLPIAVAFATVQIIYLILIVMNVSLQSKKIIFVASVKHKRFHKCGCVSFGECVSFLSLHPMFQSQRLT